jgi:hypothetical protein
MPKTLPQAPTEANLTVPSATTLVTAVFMPEIKDRELDRTDTSRLSNT